uniref:Serine/threonine-protein kinase Chk2 n=1 Tax=Strigamia maritima TaxID=126957 RepID=T1IRU8_STRMM
MSQREISDHNAFIPTFQSSLSSGANTLSSMETLEVNESYCSEDEESHQLPDGFWGRLFPLGTGFKTVDLCKQEYTFGRGDDCDYSFNSSPLLQNYSCFLAYSKVHFKITRGYTSTGWHTVLEDQSSNGTFINGSKVGKDNKQVLVNNDEISVAMKKNKAFVYMDPSSKDDLQFPDVIRQQYTMSKVLGRGACGEVRLAFEKRTCRKFAVKVISKKTFSVGGKTAVNNNKKVIKPMELMISVFQPCIIRVEDVLDTPDTLFIVLELVEGGELFDRVVNNGQLSEDDAKLLFYQMVCAVKYLHDQGITHRDLKIYDNDSELYFDVALRYWAATVVPENVLLATDERETLIKVTDFGLSKFVDGNTLMKTFCGTPNYLAPEVLLTAGTGSYTQAIDCWSLGVILFICLGGYPPFSDEYKEMPLTQQIIQGYYKFPKQYWGNITEPAKDLIRKLLTVDVKQRLTLEDALNHPWLKDEEMLCIIENLMTMYRKNVNEPIFKTEGPKREKPRLKRQREESDDTIDSDTTNEMDDGLSCSSKRAKFAEVSSTCVETTEQT